MSICLGAHTCGLLFLLSILQTVKGIPEQAFRPHPLDKMALSVEFLAGVSENR